jgi:DNA-directed RNA polymerases I and III subunit RPAC1
LFIYHQFKVNIESESAYKPERLLPEAIKVMRNKIATIRMAAQALVLEASSSSSSSTGKAGGDGDVDMAAP